MGAIRDRCELARRPQEALRLWRMGSPSPGTRERMRTAAGPRPRLASSGWKGAATGRHVHIGRDPVSGHALVGDIVDAKAIILGTAEGFYVDRSAGRGDTAHQLRNPATHLGPALFSPGTGGDFRNHLVALAQLSIAGVIEIGNQAAQRSFGLQPRFFATGRSGGAGRWRSPAAWPMTAVCLRLDATLPSTTAVGRGPPSAAGSSPYACLVRAAPLRPGRRPTPTLM